MWGRNEMKTEHRTSNIEYRTSNGQAHRRQFDVRCSMFDVRCFLITVIAALSVVSLRADTVLNSKHNLSVTGPGTVKATTETEVCIFCHTPHRATGEQPLWNHAGSAATYTPYSSSTLKAAVGQPTGASKLCLSCHDGTVALGLVNSRPEIGRASCRERV